MALATTSCEAGGTAPQAGTARASATPGLNVNLMLAHAGETLAQAGAYHVVYVDGEQHGTFDALVEQPFKADGIATASGLSVAFRVMMPEVYLRGRNDQWFALPPASGALFVQFLSNLGSLVSCMDESHGTLVDKGTTTIDGRKVLWLHDPGDKAFTAPGDIYLSTSPQPQLVRLVQHDPEGRKKGTLCPAGDFQADFSQYGVGGPITPPPNAAQQRG